MSEFGDVMALLRSASLLMEQATTLISTLLPEAVAEDKSGVLKAEEYFEAEAELQETIAELSELKEETDLRPLLVLAEDRPDVVYVNRRAVSLRPAEFRLLHRLMQSPRRAVRYEALYDACWPSEQFVEPGQLYSQAGRLKRKLEPHWPQDVLFPLRTVKRVGLMLDIRSSHMALAPTGTEESAWDEFIRQCDTVVEAHGAAGAAATALANA